VGKFSSLFRSLFNVSLLFQGIDPSSPSVEMTDEIPKKEKKIRRLSVKDIANYYVPQFTTLEDIQNKPYARHLIKNERVIYDGIVWKRSVSSSSPSDLEQLIFYLLS
jgi:hypothetical protein